jgi:hypothetical protein
MKIKLKRATTAAAKTSRNKCTRPLFYNDKDPYKLEEDWEETDSDQLSTDEIHNEAFSKNV